MAETEKRNWPGKRLKNVGKVISIIGIIITALSLMGGGGGSAFLAGFLLFIFPGLILYGIGRRQYQKAINAPIVPVPKAPKIKGEGMGAGFAFAIVLWVIGVPLTIFGIIVLNLYALFGGLAMFLIGWIIFSWDSAAHKHDDRDAFYMQRRGSNNAKRNMWRGHKYSKKR
jgi:hypothetical protein